MFLRGKNQKQHLFSKMGLKVLLIQSHLGRIKFRPPLFPLGLCYIATTLEKHKVRILDLNIWKLPIAYQKLKEEISNFSPDLVGISIRNVDTTQRADIFYYFKTIGPTVKLIREIAPEIKIMVGGSGFSIFAREIMERIPEFDFGVYLEGEESTPELLDNLDSPELVKGIYFRKNGSVHFSGDRELPDFANLPMPKRDGNVINIKPYISTQNNIGLQTKRGCILNCGYCSYPFLSGRKLRLRSPQSVVEEIEYLISLGVTKFSIVDNIFNVPVSHTREICEEIVRRGLKVEWDAWFEIKRTTKELVLLAREAGCKHFGFSPDAATNKTLSTLKKGITEKDIEENLSLMRRINGVKAGYNFFYISPGVSLRSLMQTMILYFKIPIILFGRGGGVGLGLIRIEPHTDMHRIVLQEGFLNEETNLLPESEKELVKLFYCPASYRYLVFFITFLVKLMEKVVKPLGRFILKRFFQK